MKKIAKDVVIIDLKKYKDFLKNFYGLYEENWELALLQKDPMNRKIGELRAITMRHAHDSIRDFIFLNSNLRARSEARVRAVNPFFQKKYASRKHRPRLA